MVLLSFIIPIYNCEAYIKNCVGSIIESVSEDKRSQVEIILINDGSVDGSLEICARLSQELLNISLVTQQNKGASAARNVGLEKARGEYIWFVDADDEVTPNAISDLWPYLEKKKYDIFVCNYCIKQLEGIRPVALYEHEAVSSGVEYLSRNRALYLWNKIYRLSILKDIRFLEGTKNIEDFLFNIEVLINIKEILLLPVSCYVYNTTNQLSTSRNVSKRNLIKLSQDSFAVHFALSALAGRLDKRERVVVKQLLNHSVAGHLFSLMRFYNLKRVSLAIDLYHRNHLYPLAYEGNLKQCIFTCIVNRRRIIRMFTRLISK